MQLDPVDHHPDKTGPTYDHAAAAARDPVYRQESFQMKPGRLPINLLANLRPKPRARAANGAGMGLQPGQGRKPVMVRYSNQRPIEAGEGVEASSWSVSAPEHFSGAMPGMGALDGAGKLLAFGAAVGAALWFFSKRR